MSVITNLERDERERTTERAFEVASVDLINQRQKIDQKVRKTFNLLTIFI